jgi:hypothetical protein
MWTLIIFTLFGNAGTGGGMSTTVATVQFASQDLCTKAQTAIKDHAVSVPSEHSTRYLESAFRRKT